MRWLLSSFYVIFQKQGSLNILRLPGLLLLMEFIRSNGSFDALEDLDHIQFLDTFVEHIADQYGNGHNEES